MKKKAIALLLVLILAALVFVGGVAAGRYACCQEYIINLNPTDQGWVTCDDGAPDVMVNPVDGLVGVYCAQLGQGD